MITPKQEIGTLKGDKDEEGIKYPSLPDTAREFEYSLSTLRKKAANEGWFKKREERMALKEIINMLIPSFPQSLSGLF